MDNTFIIENLGLVHSVAVKFKGKGVEYDDLYQAGCVGLVKAAHGYDENKGTMFSTYAVPTILGEIKRLFRDGGSIKVSRSLKTLSLKVYRERETLSKELDREPTVSEIAQKMCLDIEQVTEALCAGQTVASLTVDNEDGISEIDVPISDEEERITDRIFLENIMDKLSLEEKQIVKLRFFCGKTQSETAKIIGISQVQVSRKENKLLKKLKEEEKY